MKHLTILEQKANLEKYLIESWGYTYKQVEEVQQTGETPEGQPSIIPGAKLTTKQYIEVTSKKSNPVSPQHYQQGNIQVLDFITDQKFSYLEGNIVKYICRYKTKNGLEDLEKAEYYLSELIELQIDEDDRIADQLDEEILCG